MAPLEQQLAALRLGEAQQRAAIPQEIVENIDILGGGTRLAPQNPNATFADFQITEEYAPKIRRTGGTRVGAGGVLTPFTKDETLKTAAEIKSEALMDAARRRASDALATQRGRGKEFEYERLVERYNSALESGDTEEAQFHKARLDRLAAAPGTLAAGTTYARRVEQLAADAGLTLAAAQELSKTPTGADALAAMAVKNKAAARSPFGVPELTAEQRAVVSQASAPKADALETAVSGIFSGKSRPPATFQYTSMEQANQALDSGNHVVGDEITVGTQTFTVQE
jgi:hypothetical protein